MSLRYATTENEQANNFNKVRRDAGKAKYGVGNTAIRLASSFPRLDNDDQRFENEEDTLEKYRGFISLENAGQGRNLDFTDGVNLKYGHPGAPNVILREEIDSLDDKPLQGAPNLSVPAGSLDNPELNREAATNISSYHGFNSAAEFPDGGGFGNFDEKKNIPRQHRGKIGDYFVSYRRGNSQNFGNSINPPADDE